MGKLLDFIMTNGNWEKMQRIQLYKSIKKKLQSGEELTEKEKKLLYKK